MTVQEKLTEPTLAKLTVKDFVLLAGSGAFEHYARTELIEGEIWVVNAVHRRHARVHAVLTAEIGAALKAMSSPLEFYTAPSIELSGDSMPEPDIAIAEPSEDRTLSGRFVRLAIEISDSTLKMDLGRKARLYARYAVPEYWVVDVDSGVIHQLWAPEGEAYAERRVAAFGERAVAATVEGLAVETAGL